MSTRPYSLFDDTGTKQHSRQKVHQREVKVALVLGAAWGCSHWSRTHCSSYPQGSHVPSREKTSLSFKVLPFWTSDSVGKTVFLFEEFWIWLKGKTHMSLLFNTRFKRILNGKRQISELANRENQIIKLAWFDVSHKNHSWEWLAVHCLAVFT